VAVAGAQTAPPEKSVIGEGTAIDAAAKQIKLKADDGGRYTITLEDGHLYLRSPPGEEGLKKASKLTLAIVGPPGDQGSSAWILAEETKSTHARNRVVMTKAISRPRKHEQERAAGQKTTADRRNSDSAERRREGDHHSTRRPGFEPVVIEHPWLDSAIRSRFIHFAEAKSSSLRDLIVGVDTSAGIGDKNDEVPGFKAKG